ncbi:MAG: putative SOS response-associated peptidase YedK [Parvicellaceae bacterium]|jgi:putative SOS response-associated peptidase YedK
MIVAGLCSEWSDPDTGEQIKSFTIVTTTANDLMSKMHNKPAFRALPNL